MPINSEARPCISPLVNYLSFSSDRLDVNNSISMQYPRLHLPALQILGTPVIPFNLSRMTISLTRLLFLECALSFQLVLCSIFRATCFLEILLSALQTVPKHPDPSFCRIQYFRLILGSDAIFSSQDCGTMQDIRLRRSNAMSFQLFSFRNINYESVFCHVIKQKELHTPVIHDITLLVYNRSFAVLPLSKLSELLNFKSKVSREWLGMKIVGDYNDQFLMVFPSVQQNKSHRQSWIKFIGEIPGKLQYESMLKLVNLSCKFIIAVHHKNGRHNRLQRRHNFMFSLKLEHSHHLPCHPTRHFVEEQQSIHETDREQESEGEDQQPEHKSSHPLNESSQTFNSIGSLASIQKYRTLAHKPVFKLSPEEIYEADVIARDYCTAEKRLSPHIRSLISHKQRLIEDKVYIGALNDRGTEVLERIYSQIQADTHLKDQIKSNLNQLMRDIQVRIEKDISSHDYTIHKLPRNTKRDALGIHRRRSIDARDYTYTSAHSSIRNTDRDEDDSSLGDRQPFYTPKEHKHKQSYRSEDGKEGTQAYDFSIKSEQTKKADEFIRKIQKEQQGARKKQQQLQEQKKKEEAQSLQQKRQFEEQIKQERRNYLKRRFEAKKQLKEKQLEVREKMNKEYKQFLSKYKKRVPLFRQKQETYEKIVSEQKEKKEQEILKKRKELMKSIELSEIMQHQKAYKQHKEQKQRQKQAEKKFLKKSKSRRSMSAMGISGIQESQNQFDQAQAENQSSRYYRSKIYSKVLQQDQKQRELKQLPRLSRLELLKKQQEYSRLVKQNHQPKTDAAKQKQLQEMIEALKQAGQNKNKSMSTQDRYLQGNKYLQSIHELIAELRAKGKLEENNKIKQFEEQEKMKLAKSRYRDYLAELKSNRTYNQASIETIDYRTPDDEDMQQMGYRARRLEENAKRRQTYIVSRSLDVGATLQEAKKVDEDYLQSIKAKMVLLNKFN